MSKLDHVYELQLLSCWRHESYSSSTDFLTECCFFCSYAVPELEFFSCYGRSVQLNFHWFKGFMRFCSAYWSLTPKASKLVMMGHILGLVLGFKRQNLYIKLSLNLCSLFSKIFKNGIKYFTFGNRKKDAGWLRPRTIGTSKEDWSVAIFQFYWLGIISRAYEIPLELRFPKNSHFFVSHPCCYM